MAGYQATVVAISFHSLILMSAKRPGEDSKGWRGAPAKTNDQGKIGCPDPDSHKPAHKLSAKAAQNPVP